VASIAIVSLFGWLVRFAKADQVGRNHAKSGRNHWSDHMAIKIAPAGLTMHHQHHWRIARAFIDIVDPQFGAVTRICDFQIVRRKGKIGDSGKGCIGGA